VLLQFYRKYPSILSCVDCFKIMGGARLGALFGVAFVLNQILACASTVLTMSIALNSISDHAFCTIVFILMSTIVSWLLCMPRKMKFLADFGSMKPIPLLYCLPTNAYSQYPVPYPSSQQFSSSWAPSEFPDPKALL
jgi:hypothetical protein